MVNGGDNLDIGMNLTFGTYHGTPLTWLVLAVTAEEALVITTQWINRQPYDERGNGHGWEDSGLRRWLNVDFAGAAFTDGERQAIAEKTIHTDSSESRHADGVYDTTDAVFLLDEAEAKQNFLSQGLDINLGGTGHDYWWLRTSGIVFDNGGIYDGNVWGNRDKDGGVRPALWLRCEAIGAGLAEVSTPPGGGGGDIAAADVPPFSVDIKGLSWTFLHRFCAHGPDRSVTFDGEQMPFFTEGDYQVLYFWRTGHDAVVAEDFRYLQQLAVRVGPGVEFWYINLTAQGPDEFAAARQFLNQRAIDTGRVLFDRLGYAAVTAGLYGAPARRAVVRLAENQGWNAAKALLSGRILTYDDSSGGPLDPARVTASVVLVKADGFVFAKLEFGEPITATDEVEPAIVEMLDAPAHQDWD
jgi:hypothetical protein